MASKRRSGLANDRRAYNYYYPKISVIYPKNESVCPSISLDDIATLVGATYTLNANTTLLACQTILIPAGYSFTIPGGLTLTNYGRINNKGTINVDANIINYYILYNNGGYINNMGGTITNNSGGIIYNDIDSTFTNTISFYNNGGLIYNEGYFSNLFSGNIYNYNNGTITNNNTFVGSNLYNADGSSTCGTGILNGTLPPTATGTNCPP